jgi:serine/threonine protein kinase
MKKMGQGEDSEHPRLALKELKLATDEVKKVTGTNMSEAQILETMNRIGHQHLLQTIAHYERGGKDYFLFPWAERGSLREYWKTTAPTPTPEYVMWLVAQMAGLADAVSKLHDRGCRHGDLKPDNILCFGGQSDATEDTMVPPDRLVVGDLGLAKIHDFITAMRKNIATDTKAGTMMYSPPEYVQGGTAPWSRLFDIWSLGCIYFEFVVWLLRGQHGQQTLSRSVAPNDSERNTFYTLIGGDGTTERQIAVHGTVKQYIEELLNDPRCSESTGLRRVIRLIADEMIVVALPPEGAADAREMAQDHNDEMERTQESESSRIARPVTIRLQPATTIEPEEKKKVRATAHKVHKILTTILSDMKRGITDAIGNLEPSDDPHPPSNKLNLPSHEPDQLAPKPALGTPADHRARSYLNVPVCHRIPQPSRVHPLISHALRAEECTSVILTGLNPMSALLLGVSGATVDRRFPAICVSMLSTWGNGPKKC